MDRAVTRTQLAIFTAGLISGVAAVGATLAATNATGGGILTLSMAAFFGTVASAAISGALLALATVLMSMAFAHPRVRGRFMVPAAVLLFAPLWMGCFAWITSIAGGFAIATALLAPLLYASVVGAALWAVSRSVLDAAIVVGTAIAAVVTLFALGRATPTPQPIFDQQFAIATTQLAILVALVRHAWTVLHEPSLMLTMPHEHRECRVCGYDMVNAASRTCPECGTLMPRMVREDPPTCEASGSQRRP